MIFYILMKILCMAKTAIICKVISLQLIKINEKKICTSQEVIFTYYDIQFRFELRHIIYLKFCVEGRKQLFYFIYIYIYIYMNIQWSQYYLLKTTVYHSVQHF